MFLQGSLESPFGFFCLEKNKQMKLRAMFFVNYFLCSEVKFPTDILKITIFEQCPPSKKKWERFRQPFVFFATIFWGVKNQAIRKNFGISFEGSPKRPWERFVVSLGSIWKTWRFRVDNLPKDVVFFFFYRLGKKDRFDRWEAKKNKNSSS